ncbi:hypothetical protein CANTEDRAFT_111416 [Yamadazyma tenuis ATCC 10573]|uniref:DUF202 domain-containing protein n=1 Tax=Candida tenuis (strain ATCC 10573 / BCRC 21748 / CBS 615 / JCM 9827 / NBRC 10315 / NRRL Y-1498 / VKM Y-70) TaxID=590646 RepID=G3BEN8_CANTC|nr:uncharacterized protein CANTEDRAFT_111416 [Yamadazyma tenuis ATCC 10573]EGV59939.1 hypothetical protein CANTEDRAFT_111416 [Yamadazyma tenuis ATCC 10573]
MANERTFLAWLRTGAIFVTLAITFSQFIFITRAADSVTANGEQYDLDESFKAQVAQLNRFGVVIEIMCMCLGLFSLLAGAFRFFHIQTLLIQNRFPTTRLVILCMVATAAVMISLLIVLDVKLYR